MKKILFMIFVIIDFIFISLCALMLRYTPVLSSVLIIACWLLILFIKKQVDKIDNASDIEEKYNTQQTSDLYK